MQDEDADALVAHLFAQLTARLEDSASRAAEGQAPSRADVAALLPRLSVLLKQATALIEAIAVIHAS